MSSLLRGVDLRFTGIAAAMLTVGSITLAGCPTRGTVQPPMDDSGTQPGDDTGPKPGTDVPPGTDTGPMPGTDVPPGTDTGPEPGTDVPPGTDTGPGLDSTTPPDDTSTPVDTGPPRPACPTPPTSITHTDPCPTMASCGLPSHGRVDITGSTSAKTDLQVRITLPASVLSAVGPACDRLVFRTGTGTWAPHFVTNCAMGTVWVRVPSLSAGANTLAMYYGGSTSVPAANSYDDTFDRVPMHAANTLGAYSFDEGTGSRTCPTVGTEPLDAFIHYTPYDAPQTDVTTRPTLWDTEGEPSLLAPTAHFTRNQHALNFPEHPVTATSGVPSPNRLVNWQSPRPEPWNTASQHLSVGIWVKPASPANHFNDNFQTVVCYGMPNLAARSAFWHLPPDDYHVVNNSIFNPWALFFRSDDDTTTLYQGNSCVQPCTDVIQYAHITTREPQSTDAFVNQWHFLGLTLDTTHTPHTLRRSFYDDRTYEYPRDLDLFPPGGVYCPASPPAHPDPLYLPCNTTPTTCATACQPLCPGMDTGAVGTCIWPPEAPLQYAPAPLMIASDLNDGEPQLALHGKLDDLFIINRSISPEEMQAYREHRQYTTDTLTAAVTP